MVMAVSSGPPALGSHAINRNSGRGKPSFHATRGCSLSALMSLSGNTMPPFCIMAPIISAAYMRLLLRYSSLEILRLFEAFHGGSSCSKWVHISGFLRVRAHRSQISVCRST